MVGHQRKKIRFVRNEGGNIFLAFLTKWDGLLISSRDEVKVVAVSFISSECGSFCLSNVKRGRQLAVL